jgi:DHA3 family tetracycline resistance protein-like MFS transporter
VPAELLGRVSSLDWLISIGLLPLSFALTAPAVALLGARTTLVAAGVIGAVVTASALLLPGMLDLDKPEPPSEPGDADVDVVVTRIRMHESDPSALPRPRA